MSCSFDLPTSHTGCQTGHITSVRFEVAKVLHGAVDQLNTAHASFSELIAQIPTAAPWESPRARELDSALFGSWLDGNLLKKEGREAFFCEFVALGDPNEVSPFYAAWSTARLWWP